MEKVSGECPRGCGSTLFLGADGHVTCSLLGCPDPAAASNLLQRVVERDASDRMIGGDRTDVVIYTQGWDADQAMEDEPPKVQIHGRLFINGHEVPAFLSARTLIGNDFMQLVCRIYPSTLEIVPLSNLRDIMTRLPKPDRQ